VVHSWATNTIDRPARHWKVSRWCAGLVGD
jgi:hypothetical protein